MDMTRCAELNAELEKYIRPEAFPLAIRMIKDEAEIPDKAVRPLRDMGHRIMLCQGWSYCKTTGRTMGFTADDNCCVEGSVALGWLEKPPYMKDGTAVYPRLAKTAEIGKALENMKPLVEPKEGYKGMVVSPLGWTKVDPDFILMSMNAARMCRVLDALTGQTGEMVIAKNGGRGGTCVWGFAPSMLDGKPTYVIPTFGEYRFTADSDNDMYLVLPVNYLEDLVEGLDHSHKSGHRFPIPHFVENEPVYPPDYKYGYGAYEKHLKETAGK